MTIKTSEGAILQPGYRVKGELKLVTDDGREVGFRGYQFEWEESSNKSGKER
jgi:hypothetical protein